MNSHEVISQVKEYMFKTGTVLSVAMVSSLGLSAIEASSAEAIGHQQATVTCNGTWTSESDQCYGLASGTKSTITTYDNYQPGVNGSDPGSQNQNIDFNNGDREDKMTDVYGIRDTYVPASGAVSTCTVEPNDGSNNEDCDDWDSTHNPDGTLKTTTTGGGNTGGSTTGTGTTTTGTTDPGGDSVKHTQYCVDEATHLYDSQDGTKKLAYNYYIPAKKSNKGIATFEVPSMAEIDPTCDDVAVELTVTEQIKQSPKKNMRNASNVSSRFVVMYPKQNNGGEHSTRFAHNTLKRGDYLFAELTTTASAIDATTDVNVVSTTPQTFHSTPVKIK